MGSLKYNPALDGLRAVAVLAVVLYHAGLPVPAGFVGVDVFFVISGYLITRLLADELPRIDFLHFYARRARRILPAMALVVGSTLLASLALLPDAHDAAQSAAAAAAFVANLFFQSKTGGYWSASAETMPLLHLWSLSVEEQFYLVWPVVLMLARKRPVAALWTLAVVSFLVAEALLWYSPNAAFYQMPARAWELAAGGLVALGAIRLRSPVLGLVLILAACFVPMPHFPGVGALPAVIGSTWLISALHQGARLPVLEARPVVFVGLISYSLYLWHWPLLALARATHVGETPLETRMGLVVAAFVLAVLTYRFVETPFRRMQWPALRTVAWGGLAIATLSVGALAAAPAATVRPMDDPPVLACGRGLPMQDPDCIARHRKVVLWGDSFATPWQELALQLGREQGLPVTRFPGPGCPVLLGVRVEVKGGIAAKECEAHNRQVMDYLVEHGADTVVIATNLVSVFKADPEHAQAGLANLVSALKPVKRIVFVAPTPALRDAPDNCKAAGEPCMVTRAEFEAQRSAVLAALRQYPVEVVDAGDWFLAGGDALYEDRYHVSQAAVRRYLGQRQLH